MIGAYPYTDAPTASASQPLMSADLDPTAQPSQANAEAADKDNRADIRRERDGDPGCRVNPDSYQGNGLQSPAQVGRMVISPDTPLPAPSCQSSLPPDITPEPIIMATDANMAALRGGDESATPRFAVVSPEPTSRPAKPTGEFAVEITEPGCYLIRAFDAEPVGMPGRKVRDRFGKWHLLTRIKRPD